MGGSSLVAASDPLPDAVSPHLANFGPLSAFFESILKVFRKASEHLNGRSEPFRTLASRQQLAPRADTSKSQYSNGEDFKWHSSGIGAGHVIATGADRKRRSLGPARWGSARDWHVIGC